MAPETAYAPGWVHGVGLVLENHLRWYRRNWRATAISSVLQPLLFLLAFGLGFGSLVGSRAAAVTGGAEYLVWLAPALLAMSAVQTGAFEMSYPVLAGFKWRRTYEATTATPIGGGQVALGQLAFVAVKSVLTGAVSLLVIALFGGVRSVGVLGSLVAAVLTGAAVAALVMAFSASRQDEGAAFNALFRFVVLPMTLFSGTFFPIANLPAWVQPLAWVSPLWHGTELARWAAGVGPAGAGAVLGHVAYLLVLLGVGIALSVRLFVRRLGR
ncbi:ABC transporter permease [Pseudonocardia pini]|uniref:ABC transporter permease n=1 Tax=Pseudonocardia pini TaxID=2758030 RepID=UPI0015F0F1C5|nr:ABC transporter permease [Pseudonocardia pini]